MNTNIRIVNLPDRVEKLVAKDYLVNDVIVNKGDSLIMSVGIYDKSDGARFKLHDRKIEVCANVVRVISDCDSTFRSYEVELNIEDILNIYDFIRLLNDKSMKDIVME